MKLTEKQISAFLNYITQQIDLKTMFGKDFTEDDIKPEIEKASSNLTQV